MHLEMLENNYIPLLEWCCLNIILIPVVYFSGDAEVAHARALLHLAKTKTKKRSELLALGAVVQWSQVKQVKERIKPRGIKAKQVPKMLQRREIDAAAVHPAGEVNPRVNFHFLSAIFLGVWHCRLQTSDLNYIVFLFPLPRANRKQANLSDIQCHFGLKWCKLAWV